MSKSNHLTIHFRNKEEKTEVENLKEESGLGWTDFILFIIAYVREAIKKGLLKFPK